PSTLDLPFLGKRDAPHGEVARFSKKGLKKCSLTRLQVRLGSLDTVAVWPFLLTGTIYFTRRVFIISTSITTSFCVCFWVTAGCCGLFSTRVWTWGRNASKAFCYGCVATV